MRSLLGIRDPFEVRLFGDRVIAALVALSFALQLLLHTSGGRADRHRGPARLPGHRRALQVLLGAGLLRADPANLRLRRIPRAPLRARSGRCGGSGLPGRRPQRDMRGDRVHGHPQGGDRGRSDLGSPVLRVPSAPLLLEHAALGGRVHLSEHGRRGRMSGREREAYEVDVPHAGRDTASPGPDHATERRDDRRPRSRLSHARGSGRALRGAHRRDYRCRVRGCVRAVDREEPRALLRALGVRRLRPLRAGARYPSSNRP